MMATLINHADHIKVTPDEKKKGSTSGAYLGAQQSSQAMEWIDLDLD